MKVKTLQVLWHGKDPVLSVDFSPDTGLLASCGGDKEIKLWEVREDADGAPDVRHVDTLTAHSKTVNCVRFSPGGDMLASGGDTGEVILWRPGSSTNAHGDATTWRTSAVLRGHSDDVQDLAWAPAGAGIVTGSVDNECIVWDVPKAKGVLRLQGHTHYVQGVSWDPHGEYLTSQSGDRTVRLFASRGMGASHQFLSARWCKHVTCQKVLKSAEENPDPRAAHLAAEAPPPAADAAAKPPRQPLFHDDTLQSFFRRPAWSPCGSFLALPAGIYREHADAREEHATYLYQRDRFARPALRIPGVSPAVCVRFSPAFYAPARPRDAAERPKTPPPPSPPSNDENPASTSDPATDPAPANPDATPRDGASAAPEPNAPSSAAGPRRSSAHRPSLARVVRGVHDGHGDRIRHIRADPRGVRGGAALRRHHGRGVVAGRRDARGELLGRVLLRAQVRGGGARAAAERRGGARAREGIHAGGAGAGGAGGGEGSAPRRGGARRRAGAGAEGNRRAGGAGAGGGRRKEDAPANDATAEAGGEEKTAVAAAAAAAKADAAKAAPKRVAPVPVVAFGADAAGAKAAFEARVAKRVAPEPVAGAGTPGEGAQARGADGDVTRDEPKRSDETRSKGTEGIESAVGDRSASSASERALVRASSVDPGRVATWYI
jgi:chromatin assembly factor 1 subunit B